MKKGFLNSILYYIDCFKPRISFYHSGKTYYSTTLGRICGPLVIILIIFYAWKELIPLLNPQPPVSTQTSIYYSNGYPLSFSDSNFVYSFRITIDDEYSMDLKDAYFSFALFTNDTNGNVQEINFKPCTRDSQKNRSTYFCAEDFNFTLYGCPNVFSNQEFNVLFLQVTECKNSSFIKCSPNSKDYISYFNNHSVYIHYYISFRNVELGVLTHMVIKNPIMTHKAKVSPEFRGAYHNTLEGIDIYTTSGWLFQKKSKVRTYSTATNSMALDLTYHSQTVTFFTAYLCTSPYLIEYSRYFPNISDALINIGGGIHFFLSLFGLIVSVLGITTLKKKLTNRYLNFRKLKENNNPLEPRIRDGQVIHKDLVIETRGNEFLKKVVKVNNRDKLHSKISKEFIENTIDITELVFIRRRIEIVKSLMLTPEQKNAFNFTISGTKKIEILSNEIVLSEETVNELKQINSEIDLDKARGIIKLYKSYLNLMSEDTELNRKIISNIEQDTLIMLEELKKRTGSIFDQNDVEKALVAILK